MEDHIGWIIRDTETHDGRGVFMVYSWYSVQAGADTDQGMVNYGTLLFWHHLASSGRSSVLEKLN